VWIARRAIETAREEACDESAAVTGSSIDTYVSALSKICRAVLAPGLTGVSCMASAHLKERLEYLMRYDVIRKRALSHRFVIAFAAVVVLAVTIGSGLRAAPSSGAPNTPYALNFYIRAGEQPDTLDFHGRVVEVATDRLLMQPNVTFKKGAGATIDTVAEDRDIRIELRDTGTSITAILRVSQNGTQLQESSYSALPQTDRPRNTRYTGALISLDLKDADLRDVISSFAKLTGLDIQYPPSLQGRVTINVKGMPWDEAFESILRQNDLSYELKGSVLTVKR
ncbi:MAG TPA: secretin and TonB N-terminal domain-containing protein, partial [Thermoanaerobaculia bacterium]